MTSSRHTKLTFGQRAADAVANTVGSWKFIIIQSIIIIGWIIWNMYTQQQGRFDPYPFILLNLMLSFQAAYTAPMIMMSQNRQAEVDRKKAEADYIVNRIAKQEIEAIQNEILEIKAEIVNNTSIKSNTKRERLQKLVDRLESVQSDLREE